MSGEEKVNERGEGGGEWKEEACLENVRRQKNHLAQRIFYKSLSPSLSYFLVLTSFWLKFSIFKSNIIVEKRGVLICSEIHQNEPENKRKMNK